MAEIDLQSATGREALCSIRILKINWMMTTALLKRRPLPCIMCKIMKNKQKHCMPAIVTICRIQENKNLQEPMSYTEYKATLLSLNIVDHCLVFF